MSDLYSPVSSYDDMIGAHTRISVFTNSKVNLLLHFQNNVHIHVSGSERLWSFGICLLHFQNCKQQQTNIENETVELSDVYLPS